MIAHSGFTRSNLPGSFQEWIAQNGQKTPAELSHEYLAAKQAGQAAAAHHLGLMSKKDHLDAMDAAKLNLGHSLGAPLPGFSDPGHAPAPAAPAHMVPMAMHLDHLQITAKAERSFGFKLGFLAGMLLTLIGTYLHYRRQ